MPLVLSLSPLTVNFAILWSSRARAWKATVEYHKTKDILYVKNLLGHKKLENTEIYITLEKTIFGDPYNQEFHVKVASASEEIKALLEVGYEYICEKEGLLYFRKRK